MANTPRATQYHETLKNGMLLRIDKEALIAEHGLYNYKTNQTGNLEFDEHTGEIRLTGGRSVRPELLEVKRPGGWEKVKMTRKINLRSLLFKEDGGGAPASTTTTGHTQSSSPTSGITAYGMIRHQKKRIKLYSKEKKNA